MNTRKVFKAEFSKGFVAVGPCKHCGKPADKFGAHQYPVGLRFCVRKMIAKREASIIAATRKEAA